MKLIIYGLFNICLLFFQTVYAQDLQADLRNIREQARAELEESAGTVYTVVFDNSGSMEGERIAGAKRAFQWWLSSVPAGSTWSVYCFNGNGYCVLPFTLNGQKQAAAAINSFQAKTNTPICATLRKASESIDRRRQDKPFERHVVLLFTDGEENQDSRGNYGVQEEIRVLRKKNIEVVAIGYAGAGDYMNGYASRYYSANDQQALQSGLAQVQSEIDVNAAIDITPEEMNLLAKGGAYESDISSPSRTQNSHVPLQKNADPISVITDNRAEILKWGSIILGFVILRAVINFFRRN